VNRQKSLQNILGITTGLLVMFLIFHSKLFLYLAVSIGLIGLLSPFLSKYIALAWEWTGEKIGSLVSKILLSLVFLLVIIIAFIYRLFNRKGTLDLSEGGTSYITRNHEYTPSDMDELW
jgi:hypothetical protein